MGRTNFEKLEVHKLTEIVADEVWNMVEHRESLQKTTLGSQIVRSADSIGANVAEGVGRGSSLDNKRFVGNARGSLYETMHWLRRCYHRSLITKKRVDEIRPAIEALAPKLSSYRKSTGVDHTVSTNK
jgi:four helix bundle protein